MADRVVNIKLQADATGMVQGFGRARDAVAETKARVVESARSSREAWSTVGTGLSAVGVAVTGIGAAALTTGVQYNTMQQTTRAALTTLLGSAKAANEQMDRLDEFARSSPFSKATFIDAQQQMLAFGIEARKVVPYLDAVQNAVAAAGGSNEDIAGIVEIMAKIQSSSKITAEDLNQFGGRGVNAAELIGSQMGKTAAQIREDITDGSLDAGKALDALAAGMSETYAGAADNVKNTFAGSLDRVKAAWRDFSAELARPLVDPNGGGALVDLLNWTADAMRGFEDLPGPVKSTVSALGGLVGVGSLATGAAILAIPKWVAFKDALADLNVTSGTVRGGLGNIVRFLGGPWGLALIGGAAAIATFNAAMDSTKSTTEDLTNTLKQGRSAYKEMLSAAEGSTAFTDFFINNTKNVKEMGDVLNNVAENGNNWWADMFTRTSGQNQVIGDLENLGTSLQQIAGSDLPYAQKQFKAFYEEAGWNNTQAMTALTETMPGFKSQLLDSAQSMGIATDDATLLKLALGDIQVKEPSSDLEELAGVATDTTEAIATLADEIRNFGSAQIDADRAAIDMQEKMRDLNDLMAEGTGSLDIYTEAGSDTQTAMLDVAQGASEWAAAVMEAGGSQETANGILESARQSLIDQRIALGDNAADAEAWAASRVPTAAQVQAALDKVTGAANSIPENSPANVSTNADEAAAKINNFISRLQSIPSPVDVQIRTFDALVLNDEGIADKYGRAYGGTIGFASGGTIPGIGGYVSGGTVRGRGGTKSDSVLVRLSRGEEVVQEPYASMYRRELKQMNRGDFVASSFAPQQTVVVREVGDVYVQNPLTGEYLLTAMGSIADQRIDNFSEEGARARRRSGF